MILSSLATNNALIRPRRLDAPTDRGGGQNRERSNLQLLQSRVVEKETGVEVNRSEVTHGFDKTIAPVGAEISVKWTGIAVAQL